MRTARYVIPVFTAMFYVSAMGGPAVQTNRPAREFIGTAYDIDYSRERTQVLVRPAGDQPVNLVGFVTSDMLQDVLESSLIASRQVSVTHYGDELIAHQIIRVVLLATPMTCSDNGCVTELDCSALECTATIVGQSRRLNLSDRRVLGVILTAVNSGRHVEELIVDQSGNLTRVKVNVATPPLRH